MAAASRSGTSGTTRIIGVISAIPVRNQLEGHAGGIGFPHAQQAIRITRTRTIATSGRSSRETAYLTISLPAADAHPADLQHWARCEWLIENLVHHVRDVTFREDLHQARTGTGPPSWPPCVTLQSAGIASTAPPTSPAPTDGLTADQTISYRP
ncbi:hypothetical protein [Actinoplanes solisilvae]|uniref:hypothetical protein n=1 Tax=Actinoplanes solisilvae TaxID=2486853 RepID=UPI00196B3DBA|nr:hypothetical protein [Actinoplanes solisilvae]